MQSLTVCVGFPASGKTTWAREYVRKTSNAVRLSSDDVIAMATGVLYRPQVQKEIVRPLEDWFVRNALCSGYTVIIDRTNLSVKERQRWVEMGQDHQEIDEDLQITCMHMDVDDGIWQERNAARGDAAVPDVAIKKMLERYEEPLPNEGFDQVIGRMVIGEQTRKEPK